MRPCVSCTGQVGNEKGQRLQAHMQTPSALGRSSCHVTLVATAGLPHSSPPPSSPPDTARTAPPGHHLQVDEAYELLRSKRMCSPRIEAIRSATIDLLLGGDPVPVTIAVTKTGTASDIKARRGIGRHSRGEGRVLFLLFGQGKMTRPRTPLPGNWLQSTIVCASVHACVCCPTLPNPLSPRAPIPPVCSHSFAGSAGGLAFCCRLPPTPSPSACTALSCALHHPVPAAPDCWAGCRVARAAAPGAGQRGPHGHHAHAAARWVRATRARATSGLGGMAGWWWWWRTACACFCAGGGSPDVSLAWI